MAGDPLEMERAGDPLEMERAGDPLEMKRTGDTLEMERTEDPLKMERTEDPLKMERAEDPLEIEDSEDSFNRKNEIDQVYPGLRIRLELTRIRIQSSRIIRIWLSRKNGSGSDQTFRYESQCNLYHYLDIQGMVADPSTRKKAGSVSDFQEKTESGSDPRKTSGFAALVLSYLYAISLMLNLCYFY